MAENKDFLIKYLKDLIEKLEAEEIGLIDFSIHTFTDDLPQQYIDEPYEYHYYTGDINLDIDLYSSGLRNYKEMEEISKRNHTKQQENS